MTDNDPGTRPEPDPPPAAPSRPQIRPRPPLLQFGIFQGLMFAVLWGVAMYFMRWQSEGTSVLGAVGLATFGGVLFGFSMAMFERWRRSREDNAIAAAEKQAAADRDENDENGPDKENS